MGICEGGSFEPPLNTPRGNKVKLYHFLCPNEPVWPSGRGDTGKAGAAGGTRLAYDGAGSNISRVEKRGKADIFFP